MEDNYGTLFPAAFLRATPEYALEQAEIHYTHEADALYTIARERLLYAAAFGSGLSEFVDYEGHKCTSNGCSLISAPPNEVVYVCPFPDQHPEHKQAFDGSVLHRWSGVISICAKYGVPHTCTRQMCSHQELFDGEMICALTGRSLGPPIASVAESNYAFDSGKMMTTVTLQLPDRDAINARTQQYHEARPENKSRGQQINAAKIDAKNLGASSSNLKRHVDDSGFSKHADGSSTAGPVGLIDDKKIRRRLLITSKPTEPCGLPTPMIIPSRPNQTVSQGPRFSIAGDRPTESDIRAEFSIKLNKIWDLLENAYSPTLRRNELRDAETRVVARCTDKRKTGTNVTTISREEFETIHANETGTAFEGLEAVYIMSRWGPWTSGAIRREQVQLAIDRTWKLWVQITRSPQFQQQPEPHLFQKIAGALITIVIDGYDLAGCEVIRQKANPYYTIRCSHRKTAALAKCNHRNVMLRLVEPCLKMQQLLSPPGMKRRSVDPVCGHILGQHNQIVSFLSSLVSNGLTPKQLREIYVGHS